MFIKTPLNSMVEFTSKLIGPKDDAVFESSNNIVINVVWRLFAQMAVES